MTVTDCKKSQFIQSFSTSSGEDPEYQKNTSASTLSAKVHSSHPALPYRNVSSSRFPFEVVPANKKQPVNSYAAP